MSVLDRVLPSRRALESAAGRESGLRESRDQLEESYGVLREQIAELELAVDDAGWIRLTLEGDREFSRAGLGRIIKLARLMWLKNPLIRRAVNVQKYYVFGQGVQITGRTPEVDVVVQRFLEDPVNRRSLTSHEARTQREQDLQTDGNLFFALFSNLATGHTRVHPILVDEVTEIITNPEDSDEAWFYLREFDQRIFDEASGATHSDRVKRYHPSWRHTPQARPATIGGEPVLWDQPIYHVRVGGTTGMRFGVPDVYAALDWARAYKGYLEDFASIAKSLSRWAWRLSSKRQKVSALKDRFGTAQSAGSPDTNPPPSTGAMFIGGEGDSMTPIPKAGANLSPDDGRALRTMIAAGTDIPDTILAGDPDMGNLATAKTLDRPTELAMMDRQTLWAGIFGDLLQFTLESVVAAPSGRLAGTLEEDEDGIRTLNLGTMLDPDTEEQVPVDATVDVIFPPILTPDIAGLVTAYVSAFTRDGKQDARLVTPRQQATLLLLALGIEDVDELVEDMFPDGETGVTDPVEPPAPGTPPVLQVVPQAEALMVEAVRELRAAIASNGRAP